MSSQEEPAEAFRIGEIAAGKEDWERAEDAAKEALSRVRRRKQEVSDDD